MKRKVLLILGLILILSGVGITLYLKNSIEASPHVILEGKLTTDNYDKTSYVKLYNTKKVEPASFKNKKFEKPIVVDTDIFVNHTNERTNSLYNTIDIKQLDKNKQLNNNPTYIKIIKYVAKHSNHLIGFLNLFDVEGEYMSF